MSEEYNKILYTQPVDETTTGQRIDKFIASDIEELSRSQVQKLIEKGVWGKYSKFYFFYFNYVQRA